MALRIVVVAAGVGSRFGGPKQLEPVGPADETLIDYLLVDARPAGFDRAALVIRDELTARIEPLRAHRADGGDRRAASRRSRGGARLPATWSGDPPRDGAGGARGLRAHG